MHKAWERAAGKVAKLTTVSAIVALAATTSVNAEGTSDGKNAVPASATQTIYGQPTYAQPTLIQPQYHGGIPATAQSFAPIAQPQFAAQQHFAAQQRFGAQQTPIFANTRAMGVTYGPPSYTPPEGFDPKMASSSPLPSHMLQGQHAWGHQAPASWSQVQAPNPAGAPIYGGWGRPMLPATASHYAPAEPSYAPAEPLRPNYQAAAPTSYEQLPKAPTSYSYEMAPAATTPTYVGQSQQIAPSSYATGTDPYEVVIGSHQAQQSYEMGPAPAYQSATTYSAPAPTTYEPAATTAYQAAPAYEPAPAYQAAPAYDTSTIAAPTYYDQSANSSFSAGHNHFVQVGAFRNIARAERLVRKLQSTGEQPIITQATVRGKLYHRVRVPAADKRDASYVRDRIRSLGYYEARVVRG